MLVAHRLVDYCGSDHHSEGVHWRRSGADGALRMCGGPCVDQCEGPSMHTCETKGRWIGAPAVGPQGQVGLGRQEDRWEAVLAEARAN